MPGQNRGGHLALPEVGMGVGEGGLSEEVMSKRSPKG